MAVDPSKYSIYSQRSAEKQYVDWGQVATDITKGIQLIGDERQKRKDALDTLTTEAMDNLSQLPDVNSAPASSLIISGSDMSKENLMIQTDLLKRGLITPKDFKLFLNQQKTGYANLSSAVKRWDEWHQKSREWLNPGEGLDGQTKASEFMIAGMTSLQSFGNLDNKMLWTNPTNGQMQLVIMGKDNEGNYTVMPDASKNPEKFLNPNVMGTRMNMEDHRKILSHEASYLVDKIAETVLATDYNGIITSVEDFKTHGVDGKGGFGIKDNKKMTYQDWLEGQVGALTATANESGQILMEQPGYEIAESISDFCRKVVEEGGVACTADVLKGEKKDPRWIKISYENNKMNILLTEDQKKKATELASNAIELQIGKQIKKSGVNQKENQFEYNKDKLEKDQIGYLTRVQDIVRGDLSEYSSASARGIQGMNRDADGNMKTNPAEKIDSIKRVGDQIIITYQNGKEEPVDRKDDNGNIRSTKEVMGELFQLLTPYGDSYDDIIDLYTTGNKAKTIKVSARDMDDVEITTMLKNNAARVEVMKGKKEGEEPTPKEIADAAKGITITPAQITDAKKNGIPQTYVGADAIAYSSRTPYKIKSSGDAIIRGQGDDIPSITGEEALREGIRPTAEGEQPKKKIRNYVWFEQLNTTKKMVDGTLNKVFKAYLPSSGIRSKSTIELDSDTNVLVITYKNKKVNIPGVTDVVIDKKTTFTGLDKLIAEAAKYITQDRNREFIERKGGKPAAY